MSLIQENVSLVNLTTSSLTGGSIVTPQLVSSGTISAVDINSTGDATLNDVTISGEVTGITSTSSQFAIGTFSLPASTTGNLSVTGVGFQPKLIHVIFQHPNNSSRSIFGYGFYDGTNQFASFHDTVESSNSTADIIFWVDDNGDINHVANAISMDADGFTINVTRNAIGSSLNYSYVAFA